MVLHRSHAPALTVIHKNAGNSSYSPGSGYPVTWLALSVVVRDGEFKYIHVDWIPEQICLEQICINPKGVRQDCLTKAGRVMLSLPQGFSHNSEIAVLSKRSGRGYKPRPAYSPLSGKDVNRLTCFANLLPDRMLFQYRQCRFQQCETLSGPMPGRRSGRMG